MTPNEALSDYLSSLPPSERLAKVRDIRSIGKIHPWNLSDWRTGRVRISPQWQRKISEIVGEDIFADVNNEIK